MKHKTGKVIMGATLSLAAIAVAIDHTQHPLPEIEKATDEHQGLMQRGTPCGLGDSAPCSLGGEAPCSLGGGGRFNDL